MKTKEYRLVVCTFADEADVIFTTFRTATNLGLSEAQEVVANRFDFALGASHYLVADISNVRGITSEAKAFMQSPDGGLKDILGAAIIAANPVSALIANIFIKTPKNFHAKFFYNKLDAFLWIRELKEKNVVQMSAEFSQTS